MSQTHRAEGDFFSCHEKPFAIVMVLEPMIRRAAGAFFPNSYSRRLTCLSKTNSQVPLVTSNCRSKWWQASTTTVENSLITLNQITKNKKIKINKKSWLYKEKACLNGQQAESIYLAFLSELKSLVVIIIERLFWDWGGK